MQLHINRDLHTKLSFYSKYSIGRMYGWQELILEKFEQSIAFCFFD
jgi:hypothetical protein